MTEDRARSSNLLAASPPAKGRARWAIAAGVLVIACARRPLPPPRSPPLTPGTGAAAVPDARDPTPSRIPFEARWRDTSFGAYLAPEIDWSKEDGAVDVVFHFHAGKMADTEWRAAHLKAVVVSATFGMGSAPYDRAMRDPERLARMLEEVLSSLSETARTPLRLRRLGLVSFSAGFGAVGRILAQDAYFERIDALVLLDSLHTSYASARESRERVADVHGIERYVRFAEEAKAGRKAMVITHSSIQPPDYPSSTESTAALLDAVGVGKVADAGDATVFARGMSAIYRAEAGDLHVFGFRGETARDHMKHLSLVGEVIRRYIAPRWTRLGRTDRIAPATPPSERTAGQL
jgi:hypothetical protein